MCQLSNWVYKLWWMLLLYMRDCMFLLNAWCEMVASFVVWVVCRDKKMCKRCSWWVKGIFSDTGTQILVSCVKGKYANHLHHIGFMHLQNTTDNTIPHTYYLHSQTTTTIQIVCKSSHNPLLYHLQIIIHLLWQIHSF